MARSFRPAGHLHQEDLVPSCGGSLNDVHVSSAPGHREESVGQAVGQPTDPEVSRQDVGRTSSFPLTRKPARTRCHSSKDTPGARVSKVVVAPHAKGPRPCTSETAEAGVMVQPIDHHQQSPRYWTSFLPNIGEDDVDSGRITTQRAPEKAHHSHSTSSVGGMPRDGAESVHARSGESKFERDGTHVRHTPPANMTCSDATFKTLPDEKRRSGGTICSGPLNFTRFQVQGF